MRIETVLTNPSITDIFIRDRTGSWYTIIRRYQRDVGIAYYNLDVSNIPKVRRFLLKHVVAKLPGKSDMEGTADLEDMVRIFREDQPRYKDLLTRVVRQEPLSEDDSGSFLLTGASLMNALVGRWGVLRFFAILSEDDSE